MPTVSDRIALVTLSKQLRPNTVKTYRFLLRRIIDEQLPLSPDKLIHCLDVPNSNTKRATIMALRSVLGDNDIEGFSVKALKIPEAIPRHYELQTEDTYRLAIMLSPHSARGLLMYDAGLRLGEACAVTKDSLVGQWLKVDRQIQQLEDCKIVEVKGTIDRIAVPKSLVPVIEGLNKTEEPAAVRASLRRAGMKVGIKMNPHQLRHAYITRLIDKGAPLPVVQRQARHKNIALTLKVYYEHTTQALDWVD